MPKDFMAPVPDKQTYVVNGQVVDKATYDKNKAAIDQSIAGINSGVSTTPPVVNKTTTSPMATVVNNGAVTNPQKSTFNSAKDSQASYDNGSAYANTGMREQVTLAFSPNMLDNYDVYTYHWKLFMVPLALASSGAVLDPASQTIIAESGVSDLTIDKVEVQCICTPSVESGSGTMTHVKFEIVEPSGAGLIDKMFYQSVALGIGSWTVNPYYLQLEFRGRDPNTEETIINGGPTGLGSLKWVWPIRLGTAKANVTTVGTRYEFEATLYDEQAQANSNFALMQNVVLNNLTTFGSAMQELEDKLNADQYEKLIDNYSIPDTYKIVVDSELKKVLLVNPNHTKSTSRNSDYKDLSKKTAQFNAGTGIDKVVDGLLGSTSEFQEDVQGSDTPDSKPKSINAEKSQMKKLWRVITETKPIAFDALRQDNANAFTIFIVKYDIGVLDATPAQTGQTPATKPAEKKRWDEYVKKKILNKRYNYIFTGLNDQVITLDLNMDYAFAAALSRFGGIYFDSGTSTKGISQQDNAANEKKASEQVRQTLRFINDASPGTNPDAKIAEAKKSIANSKIDDTLKAKYTVILDNAKPAQRKALTAKAQVTGGMDASGKFDTSIANATKISLSAPSTAGLTFVSDVNINSPAAKQAKSQSESIRKGKLRPVPYKEVPQESNFNGIDPNSDAGRARTSSMFATALYSGGVDASMQHIKLTIKGDPFWLFPRSLATDVKVLPYKSNMSEADAIKDIKSAHITQPDSVNIFGTDNFIVVRFRTPRVYNDSTGLSDPIDAFTEIETFSGVYKVVRAISKFEVGRFIQELECIIDPVIDLQNFLAEMDAATKKPDVELYPTNMPASSTKTQRLTSTSAPAGAINTLRDTKGNVK